MYRPLLTATVSLLALGSCVSSIERQDLLGGLHEGPALFQLEDGDAARVDAPPAPRRWPPRVGVAAPVIGTGAHDQRFSIWNSAEVDEIEEWGERLREAGLVEDVVLVPSLLFQSRDKKATPERMLVDQRLLRAIAQSMDLDAILVIRSVEAYGGRANLLGILNLTVVGLWVVPSQEMEGVSLMEAVVFDPHTGRILVGALAEGEYAKALPWVQAKEEDFRDEARLRALEELGAALERQLLRHADQP